MVTSDKKLIFISWSSLCLHPNKYTITMKLDSRTLLQVLYTCHWKLLKRQRTMQMFYIWSLGEYQFIVLSLYPQTKASNLRHRICSSFGEHILEICLGDQEIYITSPTNKYTHTFTKNTFIHFTILWPITINSLLGELSFT